MGKMGNGFQTINDNNIEQIQTNDAKKAKVENNYPASKVVHIRNLPIENENEIIQLGMHFGRVTNILILKGKGQAFLELSDVQAAINMVEYYEKTPVTLHNRRIFVQYSNHQELKTNNPSHQLNLLNNTPNFSQSQDGSLPNSILKITVDNLVYPLNTDVLLQIFLPFGSISKVISFIKNNVFHAIIQYNDVVAAQKAKTALNGQNIYNACDTLNIEYSDLSNLQIKSLEDNTPNKNLSMDHTVNHLHNMLNNVGQGGSPISLQAAVSSFSLQPSGAMSLNSLNNNMLSNTGGIMSNPQNVTVLLVTNLNEEKITAYSLFVLFGVYGDVLRVKILYNKKSNALVQMSDFTQLNVAMQNLNKRTLYGKVIGVVPSKIQNVQLPKEDHAESELTKDFSTSPLHRFKKPGSKNFQNIAPPSSNLHISNIPASTTEEFLVSLFSQDGRQVKNFRFFPKDQKMALMQMSNEEEAIETLIVLHNYKIGESYIRVSFSKVSF
ncbi:polypyrimidine tract-binding protein 2-like isoform X2 [Gordionus sp. m RMFG-2023]